MEQRIFDQMVASSHIIVWWFGGFGLYGRKMPAIIPSSFPAAELISTPHIPQRFEFITCRTGTGHRWAECWNSFPFVTGELYGQLACQENEPHAECISVGPAVRPNRRGSDRVREPPVYPAWVAG